MLQAFEAVVSLIKFAPQSLLVTKLPWRSFTGVHDDPAGQFDGQLFYILHQEMFSDITGSS